MNLPGNWELKTIGEIVTFQYGKGLREDKRNSQGSYIVYGSNGKVGVHDKFLVDKPCLIIGRKGTAGKVHISKIPCWPIDTTYFVVPSKDINLLFLFYLFSNLNLGSLDRSTAIPGLNRNDAYSIHIPIPPLPEQERIVARIEELFTRLDAGVAGLKRVQAALKRYKASVLKAACEGRLTTEIRNDPSVGVRRDAPLPSNRDAALQNAPQQIVPHYDASQQPHRTLTDDNLPELPEGWIRTTLPKIGYLGRGKSKHRPRNAEFLYGGQYPFIQTGDIRHANGVITTFLQTYNNAGLAQSKLWPKNTLCITIAANIAETAILGFDSCFPDSVVGFIANENVEVNFIEYYFRTIKENLEQYAPATAQKNINLNILNNIPISLPPLEEQRLIVAEVERRLSVAAQLEAAVETGLKRAARLRQSILKRAFEGRL